MDFGTTCTLVRVGLGSVELGSCELGDVWIRCCPESASQPAVADRSQRLWFGLIMICLLACYTVTALSTEKDQQRVVYFVGSHG